ncbi:hypothetical protein SSS_01206 [Sarcoptes scabiei]|nr:hypothetical protein SSS_01206 [Sarcoptes scabiei]
MVQGEIFLNCSLTEAFCIAIIEAAACGLQIISTKVGGIPEVLPEELIWFAEPSVEGIFKGISKAINDRIEGRIIAPKKAHDMVKSFYQWDDILSRILKVYDSVQSDPIETIDDRMRKFWNFDLATGIFFLFITVVCHFLYNFYSFFVPIESIDIAPEFDYNKLMSRNKNNENNSNENKE